MGTTELIFVLMALVLFMTIAVVVNSVRSESSENLINTQITNNAISLAQAIIDEAWAKRFDESTDLNNLTSPSNLGKDTGEQYKDGEFDDIDDFIDYPQKKFFGSDTLLIDVNVYYVDFDSSGDLVKTTSSPYPERKKMIVTISHETFDTNVQLEQIFCWLKPKE